MFAGAGAVAWRVRENNVSVYNDNSRCVQGTQTRGQQCGAYSDWANVALGVEIAAFVAASATAAIGA